MAIYEIVNRTFGERKKTPSRSGRANKISNEQEQGTKKVKEKKKKKKKNKSENQRQSKEDKAIHVCFKFGKIVSCSFTKSIYTSKIELQT